jgi:L-rhamnose mutarotase
MKEALTRAGVYDYSIYLDEETGTLFAIQKLRDDNTAGQLPQNPVVRKWWKYMQDLMEYNPDETPRVLPLKQVFHMD